MYTVCTCSDINLLCLKCFNGASLFYNLSRQSCVCSKQFFRYLYFCRTSTKYVELPQKGARVERVKMVFSYCFFNWGQLPCEDWIQNLVWSQVIQCPFPLQTRPSLWVSENSDL